MTGAHPFATGLDMVRLEAPAGGIEARFIEDVGSIPVVLDGFHQTPRPDFLAATSGSPIIQ